MVYCTHVFDGLAPFMTHAMLLERGRLLRCGPAPLLLDAEAGAGAGAGAAGSLHGAVLGWLREGRLGAVGATAAAEEEAAAADEEEDAAAADAGLFARLLGAGPAAALEVEHFTWGFDRRRPLFRDLTFRWVVLVSDGPATYALLW